LRPCFRGVEPPPAHRRGPSDDHRPADARGRRDRQPDDRPDGDRRRERRCRRRPDVRDRQSRDRQRDREDVDRAVAAARTAFDDRKGWANWAAGKRGRTLAKFADLIKKNSEELAWLESRNVGKPIGGARGEIIGASLVFDYYAGAANKVFGETIPVGRPGIELTLREPIGVIGAIVPWNFPMYMASWKLGPALAAGNTVVLKPASASPLTAIRLGELALEAGIPPGVLNVVTGPGGTVGASIAAHEGIGKVAFTGETITGQEIMRLASANVKKISLELGGKSPNVVFADADLEKFAREAVPAIFSNCGQDCTARSRILVERSVHADRDAGEHQAARARRGVCGVGARGGRVGRDGRQGPRW
jgi:betaine-aldehyde dehydrogenase